MIPDDLDERLRRLREALAELGRRPGATPLRLWPPLEEARLAAFESRHGIRLPDSLRRFLVELGNGGDGPAFHGWRAFDPEDPWYNRPEHWSRPFVHPRLDGGESSGVGYIPVGDDGCGIFDLVVVTGEERGHVWWSDSMSRKLPQSAPGHGPWRGGKDDWEAWRRELLDESHTYRVDFVEHFMMFVRSLLARK